MGTDPYPPDALAKSPDTCEYCLESDTGICGMHRRIEEAAEKNDLPAKMQRPIQIREVPNAVDLVSTHMASTKRFTKEQQEILSVRLPDEEHEILPTGEVYISQVHYRRILTEAFGPGGWALLPMGDFVQDGSTLCREYGLFCEGRFVGSAWGETDFQPKNPRYTKATAAESLKSNALMRCCKDLLIGSECWDRRYTRKWIAENAVEVWCAGVAADNRGKKKKLWRRKDDPAFGYPWQEEAALPPSWKPEKPPTPTSSDEPIASHITTEKPTSDDLLFFKAMAVEKERLGEQWYYKMLGAEGYEHCNQIPFKDRVRVYKAIKKTPAPLPSEPEKP